MDQENPLFDEDLDRTRWMQDVVGPAKGIGVQGIDLSVQSPFFTIWTRPRETIRGIVETDPAWHVVPIAMLAAITQSLHRASTRSAGDKLSLTAILAVTLVLGPLGGVVGLHLGGWLLCLTGSWLGGRAKPEELRAAIGWSSVPTMASLPLWLILLAFLGREVFTTETPTLDAYPALGLLFWTGVLASHFLRSWTIFLLLKCVSEVQGFSVWRALGSLLLTVFVVLVPILLVVIMGHLLAR
jgi:hypothetical protein